jgi:hypothetical protein
MQVSTEVTISMGLCSCQLNVVSGPNVGFGAIRLDWNLPRIRVDLAELDLMRCYWLALAVEYQESGAGRTLID